MMSRLLLLPFLLASCVEAPRPAPTTERAAAEQACSSQIYSDPEVESNLAKSAGQLSWQWDHSGRFGQIEQDKLDAMTRCLRARGVAAKGGVERPR